MVMSINQMMVPDGAALYYSEPWMRMIESHLSYLRERSVDNVVAVLPYLGNKHEADLFGLLRQLRVRAEHHWIVMRLNDFTSPNQIRSDREFLILPNFDDIEKLRSVFQTINKKTG